jgi:hypothetical protein
LAILGNYNANFDGIHGRINGAQNNDQQENLEALLLAIVMQESHFLELLHHPLHTTSWYTVTKIFNLPSQIYIVAIF